MIFTINAINNGFVEEKDVILRYNNVLKDFNFIQNGNYSGTIVINSIETLDELSYKLKCSLVFNGISRSILIYDDYIE